MFGYVSVLILDGQRQFNAGAQQPIGLIRAGFRNHAEGNLAWLQAGNALTHRDDLAARWQNARHLHQIVFLNARMPKRQFQRLRPILVRPVPLREKTESDGSPVGNPFISYRVLS